MAGRRPTPPIVQKLRDNWAECLPHRYLDLVVCSIGCSIAMPLTGMARTCLVALIVPIALCAQDVISTEQRLKWVVSSTVGPASLAGGAVSAGFGTLINLPSEYGTHWSGFGKRYGM